jgi:hypothetical protein
MQDLVGKCEGKKLFGRLTYRLKGSIKIDLNYRMEKLIHLA